MAFQGSLSSRVFLKEREPRHMLWAERHPRRIHMLKSNRVPQDSYIEVITPVPQNVTRCGDRVIKKVIKLQ